MVEKERWRQGDKLMKLYRVLLITMLLLLTVSTVSFIKADEKEYKEAIKLYNGIGTLKGKVTEINNPELGITPASGQYLLFQRIGCNKCVIGVRADINGRYALFLASGRYRLIPIYEPQGDTDIIRKGQVREVTVVQGAEDTEFNIELELPE